MGHWAIFSKGHMPKNASCGALCPWYPPRVSFIVVAGTRRDLSVIDIGNGDG